MFFPQLKKTWQRSWPFISSGLILWSVLFLLSSITVLSDWLKNRDQVTLQDLIVPLATCLIISGLITAATHWVFRTNRMAATVIGVIAIFLVSQGYNEFFKKVALKMSIWGGNRLLLVFFLTTIIVGFIILIIFHRLTKRHVLKTNFIYKGILITIIVAFLVNFLPFIRIVIIEWPQFFYHPAEIKDQLSVDSSLGKPDIYYIVLDRYASQSVLKNQFNYENSDFLTFLSDHQFYINPGAYSSYPFTTMSLSSTLNLDYHADLVNKFSSAAYQTVQPYHEKIYDSSAVKKLKSIGYTYYHIGTWYEASSFAPLADYYYQLEGQLYLFNHRITLSSFANKELLDSVFSYVIRHEIKIGDFTVLNYTSQSRTDATLGAFDQLKKIAESPSGGRFIFAHILSPHYPYYFNAEGSLSKNPSVRSVGGDGTAKEKYVRQMEFVNSRMKAIIELIDKNSKGRAVIILQSDEGEYPIYINYLTGPYPNANEFFKDTDMTDWSDDELKLKYGILAAYRLPQVKVPDLISGADSVNIFRLLFNSYFQTNLSYLPRCYYAYQKGRVDPFVYLNINKRLTGQDNPACSPDGR